METRVGDPYGDEGRRSVLRCGSEIHMQACHDDV